MHTRPPRISVVRSGITLLEVLISIGILAVGLGSIVALIPAGRAQAGRAVILDRGASLAANVLADAATFGLLRPECLTAYPAANVACIDPTLVRTVSAPPTGGGATLTIPLSSARGLQMGMNVRWAAVASGADWVVQNVDEDGNRVEVASSAAAPLPGVGDLIWFGPSFASPAVTKPQGLFAGAGDLPEYAPAVQLQAVLRGSDDLVVAVDATNDDPPLNPDQFTLRPFEGRMSAIACLLPPSGKSLPTLSVVTFHGRDPALPTLTATLESGTLTIPPWQVAALDSRSVRDVIKPGVVVCSVVGGHCQLHTVTAARITPIGLPAAGTYDAWMTFSTGASIPSSTTPVTLTFLPDSVGLAERPFAPEATGDYTR